MEVAQLSSVAVLWWKDRLIRWCEKVFYQKQTPTFLGAREYECCCSLLDRNQDSKRMSAFSVALQEAVTLPGWNHCNLYLLGAGLFVLDEAGAQAL